MGHKGLGYLFLEPELRRFLGTGRWRGLRNCFEITGLLAADGK